MRELARTIATGAGGIGAAFLGGLCCAGPLVYALLGLSAGLAGRFEALRPLFGAVMLAAFTLGFRRLYRHREAAPAGLGSACQVEAGDAGRGASLACAVTPSLRRERIVFWSAAALALVLWTLPLWSARVVR